jgi:hypothetical protein
MVETGSRVALPLMEGKVKRDHGHTVVPYALILLLLLFVLFSALRRNPFSLRHN